MNSTIRVFGFVSVFLIFISIFLTVNGKSYSFSFESFLSVLQNAPSVLLPVDFSAWFIAGEWAVLDELRIFLNGLGRMFGILAYSFSCIGQLLVFVFYFLSSFLGFA